MVNNTSSNCTPLFDERQLMILGVTQGVAACFSCIGCFFIFFIMLIFKKYVYSTQRLFLYLTISVLLVSISFIIRGYGYNLIDNTVFCEVIAFYSQYSGGCILAAVSCIVINIFVCAVLRKEHWNLEPMFVIIIFIVPALLDWVPFISHTYGPTKTWCWIRNQDLATCKPHLFGIAMQYVLWFIPLYSITIIGGILYIISLVAISRWKSSYTAMVEPQRLMLQKSAIEEIKPYQWYPLLYIIVNIVPLVARILNDINPNLDIFFLWVIAALIQGLQGGFVTIVFSLDPETRRRLKWKELKTGFKYNILNLEDTLEYPIITAESDSKLTDSLEVRK